MNTKNSLRLTNPKLIKRSHYFKPVGKTALSKNHLSYLKIDDDYIHQLFPLLKLPQHCIKKPAYFGKGLAGAHISIIYPEDNQFLSPKDIDQVHDFEIMDLIKIKLGLKTYYALTVESESLTRLRKNYGLSECLYFKGYPLGFHITIGVEF